jgi:hypothetical protein
MTMLKKMIATAILATGMAAGAKAQTIVLLPEPGSLEPATIIVDPKAGNRDRVLVCSSLSQITTGGCMFRNWAQTGLRRP